MTTPVNLMILSDAPRGVLGTVLAAAGIHPAILNGQDVTATLVAGQPPMLSHHVPQAQAQAEPQPRVMSEESMRIAYLEAKLQALYAKQNSRAMSDENIRLRQHIDELKQLRNTQAEVIEDMHKQLADRDRKQAPPSRSKKKAKKKAQAKKPLLHGRVPSLNGAS